MERSARLALKLKYPLLNVQNMHQRVGNCFYTESDLPLNALSQIILMDTGVLQIMVNKGTALFNYVMFSISLLLIKLPKLSNVEKLRKA